MDDTDDLTSDSVYQEACLYSQQPRFVAEDAKETAAFAAEIQRLSNEFALNLIAKQDARELKILQLLKHNTIDQVRKQMVPAYTFTRFNELPVEIRVKIWLIATCYSNESFVHTLWDLGQDQEYGNARSSRNYAPGSSRIRTGRGLVPFPFPPVLHACGESRAVAQTIYTRLPCTLDRYDQRCCEIYFNTVHDIFYIGGKVWTKFKILVDLMIKINSTRPLPQNVQEHIQRLLKIRRLVLDVSIFGALPIRIWSEFPKLEELVVSFNENDTISPESDEKPCLLKFIKPREDSKNSRRAEAMSKTIMETLGAVKKEIPDWEMPKIRVLLRLEEYVGSGTYHAGWTLDGEDLEGEDLEEDNDEFDSDNNEDDSFYHDQLTKVLRHCAWENDIKRLKTKYHRYRNYCWPMEGRMYFTDSEDGSEDDDSRHNLPSITRRHEV